MVRSVAIVVVILCATRVWAAGTVTVVPDRTTVNKNESLTVVYTYSEELHDEPGFVVLEKDFDILAQNRLSSLQSINGTFSYQLSWTLTLMPKRVGKITLPPVAFDGVSSEALVVTVNPASQDDTQPLGDLSLEVEFTPAEGYVQGQFIYTLRLYHRGWLAGGDLSDPDFGGDDAVVRQLDQIRRYSLFRGGERYQVYEQSYLVFPQRSGELSAAPAVFTGQLREPGRSPRLKRVSAPAASVVVKPVPDAVSGHTFLPASALTIEEEWPDEPVVFEQGRPVTRQLRITARGLTAAQLPEIEFDEIDGVRVYADQANREDLFAQDGVTGIVEQSIALVPQRGGSMTLPAVEIEWWDTQNRRARVASLPARNIVVQSAAIAPVSSSVSPGPESGTTVGDAVGTGWRVATFVMLALWLVTLAAWHLQTTFSGREKTAARRRDQNRPLFSARSAVKKACNEVDPKAAAAAMLLWGQAIWTESPPRSLNDIAGRVEESLAAELGLLSELCYGRGGQWSKPHQLWRLIGQWQPRHERRKTQTGDAELAPL